MLGTKKQHCQWLHHSRGAPAGNLRQNGKGLRESLGQKGTNQAPRLGSSSRDVVPSSTTTRLSCETRDAYYRDVGRLCDGTRTRGFCRSGSRSCSRSSRFDVVLLTQAGAVLLLIHFFHERDPGGDGLEKKTTPAVECNAGAGYWGAKGYCCRLPFHGAGHGHGHGRTTESPF